MSKKILDEIIGNKRKRLEKRKQEVPLAALKEQVEETKFVSRSLNRAISETDGIALIAELKKASPSAGVLREEFDPVAIAKEYDKAGANAISVLTEEGFFKGSLDILSRVKGATSRPVLAKDFFIDEYQIYEAKCKGADSILLIAGLLERDILVQFMEIARGLELGCLVEVHNEDELEKAIASGVEIIGINNRNLENFEVDLKTTERLCKLVPEGRIKVSESGINTREDVEYLCSVGVDAILVGEALMRAKNISAKIGELLGENDER